MGETLLADASSTASQERLKKVLIVSRHGIRRQFPSSTFSFSEWSPGKAFDTADESWGVDGSKGVLTEHGYAAARLMGEEQGRRYKDVVKDCESAAFVYCEEDMPRDAFTAEGFFTGFFSEKGAGKLAHCKPPELYSEGVEYLIDQGSKTRGEGCSLGTQKEVEGRIRIDEYKRIYQPLLEKLNSILGCCDPSLCQGLAGIAEKDTCTILDLPHEWDEEHWYVTFKGPIYAGKFFSEWFELSMLNGMDFGFGELSEEDVMALSQFVTLYRSFEFDLLAARPFGSALLLHMLATLEQWETGSSLASVAHHHSADIVYMAAHDTNILYIGELLGLKWLNEGWQPNHTPPGGMLVLELYEQEGSQEMLVGAFFDVQRPGDMRRLTPDTPPDRFAITIPGCSGHGDSQLLCPLSGFRALVLRAVDLKCVVPTELKKYGRKLWLEEAYAMSVETGGSVPAWGLASGSSSSADSTLASSWVFGWFFIGALLGMAISVVGKRLTRGGSRLPSLHAAAAGEDSSRLMGRAGRR
jgi:4-phytase/acid phosphatase